MMNPVLSAATLLITCRRELKTLLHRLSFVDCWDDSAYSAIRLRLCIVQCRVVTTLSIYAVIMKNASIWYILTVCKIWRF